MPAIVSGGYARNCGECVTEVSEKDLNALITAMGKRLQAEYIEGAIPYLREREPELWSRLEALDREESLSALIEYERLFFEGLQQYIRFRERRKAA
jgi:hypothetical protein